MKCKELNSKEIRSNNKACDKSIPETSRKPIYAHFTGVKFFTCPSNFYQESFVHWFDISRHFENGNMMLDLDEPNKNVEARQFADSLRANYHNEKMKEVKR